MALALLNIASDTFDTVYSRINSLLSYINLNDITTLTTTNKTSLVAAINEVNAKKVPFYLKDSATKTNITLE